MDAANAIKEQTGRERYCLSERGAYNYAHRDIWGPREKSMANLWSPANPDGLVSLLLAENNILHDEISRFFNEQIKIVPDKHLTYGLGPRGSRRLRNAAATFVNEELQAVDKVTGDDIIVTPGLNSAIESLVWAICNPGDGVLIPRPLYNGFAIDILNRNATHLVGVSYQNIEGYRGLDDLFRPDINKLALEQSLSEAEQAGIKIRALLISQSVFDNPGIPSQTPFVSTASMSQTLIDSKFHHILYGASKDLCANGLRFFSWSPHVLQDVWAAMLEDKQWFKRMMRKKNLLMAAQYAMVDSFFRVRNIFAFPMNAGLFLWVDLRRLLLSKSPWTELDYGVLSTRNTGGVYKQRETEILDVCLRNDVQIAPGSNFESEEYGWFRITFTVPRDMLEEVEVIVSEPIVWCPIKQIVATQKLTLRSDIFRSLKQIFVVKGHPKLNSPPNSIISLHLFLLRPDTLVNTPETMKILTKEQEEAHYAVVVKGGLIGGGIGLGVGPSAVLLASKRFLAFRNLTLPFRTFLVNSCGTFGAIVNADRASAGYHKSQNPMNSYKDQTELAKEIARENQSSFERLVNYAREKRYSIVFASWLASMGVALAIVSRSPMNAANKAVQARMYVQALTLIVLVATAILEMRDVAALDSSKSNPRVVAGRNARKEQYEDQDLWKDMVATEERLLAAKKASENRM
ncbi:hypothetical protein FDECE_5915 [Fusarium decemcellulare]|nr:hypothetical protein FDECE_5915 [Fusarium decemcellulare]